MELSGGLGERPGARRGVADEVGQGIADTEESRDSRDRPHRGRTVTVGIDRLGNRGVAGGEAEQAADLREDGLLVGADQPGRTDLDRLRMIRTLAKHQDGFAEGRGLLLQPAGIGQDDTRCLQQLDELTVGEGIAGDDVVQADQWG